MSRGVGGQGAEAPRGGSMSKLALAPDARKLCLQVGLTDCAPLQKHLDGLRQVRMSPAALLAHEAACAAGREPPGGWGWPEWVYVPEVLVEDYLRNTYNFDSDSPQAIHSLTATLTGVLTWRVTQGVYAFDPDLLQALIQTPLDTPIPFEVLLHLPEWCCYIPTPGKTMDPRWREYLQEKQGPTTDILGKIDGFFVSLQPPCFGATVSVVSILMAHRVRRQTTEGASQEPETVGLLRSVVPVSGRETIPGAIRRHVDLMGEVVADADWECRVQYIHECMSLVLYLCARNRDLVGPKGVETPPKPKEYKDRTGAKRTEIPSQPTLWAVGARVGAALRQAEARSQSKGEGTGTAPRPHVRRAHWHTYLLGPKGSQRAELRWLHPILVGGGDVVPTVRAVAP